MACRSSTTPQIWNLNVTGTLDNEKCEILPCKWRASGNRTCAFKAAYRATRVYPFIRPCLFGTRAPLRP